MPTHRKSHADIALIGFGEAANAFVAGWALDDPSRIAAYDIKSEDAETTPDLLDRYARTGVSGATSARAALQGASVVFSVVTADQALSAARDGAGALDPGALWLDCNSCAPDTKRRAAEVIEAHRGRYVDVAVMSPVHPKGHHAPLNLSGPHAEAAAVALRALDMRPEVVGAVVGEASSIKMIRSVMIKGFEALTTECFLAARRAGVEEAVLASLEASDPDIDWRGRGAYNLGRMMAHGGRRAAEMREVAVTLADLGLPNAMSQASSVWQDRVAQEARAITPEGLAGNDAFYDRLDRVLTQLTRSARE